MDSDLIGFLIFLFLLAVSAIVNQQRRKNLEKKFQPPEEKPSPTPWQREFEDVFTESSYPPTAKPAKRPPLPQQTTRPREIPTAAPRQPLPTPPLARTPQRDVVIERPGAPLPPQPRPYPQERPIFSGERKPAPPTPSPAQQPKRKPPRYQTPATQRQDAASMESGPSLEERSRREKSLLVTAGTTRRTKEVEPPPKKQNLLLALQRADTFRQGVILAEILGPPRGLRPWVP